MLRIYLDQNKWVALARARFGRQPEAGAYQDVLDLAAAAVSLGVASFPLSTLHYIELQNQPNPGKRWRLATFMAELSRFHTIGPANVLLETGIDLALQTRYGVPIEAREHPVFGLGFGHASGDSSLGFWARKRDIDTAEDWFIWEKLTLGAPPLNGKVLDRNDKAMRLPAQRYRDGHQKLAEEFKKMEVERNRMRDMIIGFEVMDILDPLLVATRRAGLPDGVLRGKDDEEPKKALTAFVRDLPTRDVPLSISQLRHESHQETWNETDLPDMGWMAVAIPYCDVVVAEKKMAHYARRATLDSRYETRILTDLSDLRDPLIQASVAS